MPDETLTGFAGRVAAPVPAPGGGAVAAVVAALAAALSAMVAGLALPRKPEGEGSGLVELAGTADRVRTSLLQLAHEDEVAYARVIEARRSGDERALAGAWREAARIPAEVVRLSREAAQLARRAAREGPRAALGDAAMAALLAAAAAAGSQINLRFNVQAAGRPEGLRMLADRTEVELREAQHAATEVRLLVEQELGGKN